MTIVSPDKIASEFSQLWSKLETKHKTRACLFNLLIFSPKNERCEYLKQISLKVMEKFPCRLIFITVSDEKEKLQTKISVVSPNLQECDVVCDLLEIEISKDWEKRIPFIVLPHLISDLPVCMVWGEDITKESFVLSQLERFVDRLIVDSELTVDLKKFASAIVQKKKVCRSDIADLNWARTESFRTLMTSTFYSPTRLELLENAKEITVGYNNLTTPFFCHCHTQAIYLQAWLASRLGWKYKSNETDAKFCYTKENREITIHLNPSSHTQLPAGNLLSFELLSCEDEHCKLMRNIEKPQQIRIDLSSKEKCDLPIQFLLTKSQLGQSLVKEIFKKGTSQHYLGMLQKIDELKLTC